MRNKKLVVVISFMFIAFLTVSVGADTVERRANFNFNAVSDLDGIAQLGIFYPLKNSENSIIYTDMRARSDIDSDVLEWNLGAGYRFNYQDKHLAGIYLFRDRRKEFDYYWDMWTLGGEMLTDKLDIRINAYLADNERIEDPAGDLITSAGGRLIYNKSFYTSMDGLDLEFGKRWRNLDNAFNNLGVYLRFYKFFADDIEDLNGKEIRINKEFGQADEIKYQLGLKWDDNDLNGSSTEATFAVSIPFGSGETSKEDENVKDDILESRMTEAPQRDLNVVVAKSDPRKSDKNGEKVTPIDPITGKEVKNIYYVTKTGSGDGTKADPTNIEAVKEIAVENDLIVLLGSEGEIQNDVFEMQAGQKLLSPGGKLKLSVDPAGNRSTYFTPQGEKATLTGNPGGQYSDPVYQLDGFVEQENTGLIVLNDDTTVSGLELKVEGEAGGNLIYAGDLKGQVNLNNNEFIQNTENIAAPKLRGTLPSAENNRAIYIDSEIAQGEELKLIIENNKFTTSTEGAVELNITNKVEDPIMPSLYSRQIEEEIGGSFKLGFNKNQLDEVKNYGIMVNVENLKENEIKINNNHFSNISSDNYNLSIAAAIIVNQNNRFAESETNSVQINENVIQGIEAAFTAKGILVNNNFNEKANLKTEIEGNTVVDLVSGASVIGPILNTKAEMNGPNYLSTEAVAVYNSLNNGGTAETKINSNIVKNLEGHKISQLFDGDILREILFDIAADFAVDGIVIVNSSNQAKVWNEVIANQIDLGIDSSNEGSRRAVRIKNSNYSDQPTLAEEIEEAEIKEVPETIEDIEPGDGYTLVSKNEISNIQSNYGLASGINVVNENYSNTYTIVNANIIDNIQSSLANANLESDLRYSSRVSPPVTERFSTNGIYVDNQIKAAGTAVAIANNNTVKALSGLDLDRLLNVYYLPREIAAEVYDVNGISINNLGENSLVKNELIGNNLDLAITADNDVSQRGIKVNNGRDQYYYDKTISTIETKSKIYGLKSAENILKDNLIKNLYSNYGISNGIVVKNEVIDSVTNEIITNKLYNIKSQSNYEYDEFLITSAIAIANQAIIDEAEAFNKINKNIISEIGSLQTPFAGIAFYQMNKKETDSLSISENDFSDLYTGIIIPEEILSDPDLLDKLVETLEQENIFDEQNTEEKIRIIRNEVG